MGKQRTLSLMGLLIALAVATPRVSAQVTLIDGTFTGGSSFATTMTGKLTWLNGLLTLDITNVGSGFGEVFAAIAIVNVPSGVVTPGTAPSNWQWERTQQYNGEALPDGSWAWVVKPPPPHKGLQMGESATFTYNIGSLAYQNIGFGVHAISGPFECSTKFSVWNGGRSQSSPATDPESVACRPPVTVPEPESMALLATGIAGLLFVAVRRRKDLELVDEDGNQI